MLEILILGAIGALSGAAIGALAVLVIEGILSFTSYVVDYFRGLKLRKGRDIPFIANGEKMSDIIHSAPEYDTKGKIFEATYNEDTNEIENWRTLVADEWDQEFKNALRDEKLVVLS